MISLDLSTLGFNKSSTGATETFSHTITGSNPFLVVDIITRTPYSGAGDRVTGVTWNGVSLTRKYDGGNISMGGANERCFSYVLQAPATGTHSIVVSFSGMNTNDSAAAIATSYVNAKQSGQIDTSTTGTNAVGGYVEFPATMTTAVNVMLHGVAFTNNPATVTAGTDANVLQSNTAVIKFGVIYSGPKISAGSNTLNFIITDAGGAGYGAISILPAPSGPAHAKSYNGVLAANVKSINAQPIANIKSKNGVS